MRIALKVDVDTLRGTLEGVPALVGLFRRYRADATFLFSLGPDRTGRAIRRIFRPGFLDKVGRTSVTRHYGYRTLLYGTLLPGPDIAHRAGSVMRAVADAGFETGIHAFDHVRWQDFVASRDGAWARREMEKAEGAYRRVFGRDAYVHGAAGWQVNDAVPALESELNMLYASDCRGSRPFRPWVNGVAAARPQLPTTLPTLDELIGRDGWTETNVDAAVKAATVPRPEGHVYTLHAELEGMRLLPVMERLLHAWRDAGHELVDLHTLLAGLDPARLPVCPMIAGSVPGRGGTLAVQGTASP
jgi:peptidoglycan/xylan/chitin deacetylase (PgdA/CDA1 family)